MPASKTLEPLSLSSPAAPPLPPVSRSSPLLTALLPVAAPADATPATLLLSQHLWSNRRCSPTNAPCSRIPITDGRLNMGTWQINHSQPQLPTWQRLWANETRPKPSGVVAREGENIKANPAESGRERRAEHQGRSTFMAAASPFLSFSLLLLLLPASNAIYCDEDDCYDLLGVKQDANASEIRKAYYKLSLKYHPDKNPDPESRKLFVKVANAYEILKDEETREQYDYAIAHPEEVFYNTAQYYRAYYGHKTDPRAVLIGLLLIVSAFQYINQLTMYNQAIESVKQTPAYRNRLKALEFERTGGIASKKKGHKQLDKKVEDELINEVGLQIQGVEKPSVWSLCGVQFVLLPYIISKLLTWEMCWFWRYRVKKLPYAWEDACYLTRTSLKIPASTWQNIDESTKEDLVMKRLWEKSNMERHVAEIRKGSKRRR